MAADGRVKVFTGSGIEIDSSFEDTRKQDVAGIIYGDIGGGIQTGTSESIGPDIIGCGATLAELILAILDNFRYKRLI